MTEHTNNKLELKLPLPLKSVATLPCKMLNVQLYSFTAQFNSDKVMQRHLITVNVYQGCQFVCLRNLSYNVLQSLPSARLHALSRPCHCALFNAVPNVL